MPLGARPLAPGAIAHGTAALWAAGLGLRSAYGACTRLLRAHGRAVS